MSHPTEISECSKDLTLVISVVAKELVLTLNPNFATVKNSLFVDYPDYLVVFVHSNQINLKLVAYSNVFPCNLYMYVEIL